MARFRQVDVFGSGPFSGNPLAVVLDADDLSTEQMRRISAWTNLSECTFVLPPTAAGAAGGADYRVQIFSLTTELPFAGHPTLGTARAWLDAGGASAVPGLVVQECAAGLIPVRDDGDRLAFAAPPLRRSGPLSEDELADVVAVLGVEPGAVVASAWIDNGPGWAGVLLADAEAVLALQPDARRRPGAWTIGVAGPHTDGRAEAIEVRAFFTDGAGPLVEDPVTGSLNASLAQWLLAAGVLTAPYTASQGAQVGRSGRVAISQDDDGGVWVGGAAVVAVTGEIALPSES